MRSIEEWLEEYNESHQNPTNKTLHWICVPLIVFSLLGLLFPLTLAAPLPVSINGAAVLLALAIFYYLFLSWQLALGMLAVSALMLLMLAKISTLATPLWLLSVIIFVLAWIGQFIGHKVEGKKPSFFKDVQFLLIGPLWLLSAVYRKLNIPY